MPAVGTAFVSDLYMLNPALHAICGLIVTAYHPFGGSENEGRTRDVYPREAFAGTVPKAWADNMGPDTDVAEIAVHTSTKKSVTVTEEKRAEATLKSSRDRTNPVDAVFIV